MDGADAIALGPRGHSGEQWFDADSYQAVSAYRFRVASLRSIEAVAAKCSLSYRDKNASWDNAGHQARLVTD